MSNSLPNPMNSTERYLYQIAEDTDGEVNPGTLPTPRNRTEQYLQRIAENIGKSMYPLLVGMSDETGALDQTYESIVAASSSRLIELYIDDDGEITVGYFSSAQEMTEGDHDGEFCVAFFMPSTATCAYFYATVEDEYPVLDAGD